MSITDELREIATKTECANGRCEKLYRGDLEHIADRIDAEHERQCAESWMRGHDAWAAIDRSDEMAEHGWVKLPVDADGVPIHAGDVLTDGKHTYTVTSVTFDSFAVTACGHSETSLNSWPIDQPGKMRHHHEPTVEDVLTEFGIDWEHESDCEDRAALLKEYATKLQLREDA